MLRCIARLGKETWQGYDMEGTDYANSGTGFDGPSHQGEPMNHPQQAALCATGNKKNAKNEWA
jgi:hypothetical protein